MTFETWLSERFGPLLRLAPLFTLACLLLAIGFGLTHGVAPDRAPGPAGTNDLDFYTRVVDRVRRGEPYYPVAVQEVRLLDGPAKPFMIVRTPLLATVLAALPGKAAAQWIQRALICFALGAWCLRLGIMRMAPLRAVLALVALCSGYVCMLADQAYLMHETWAGLLVAAGLAVYRPGRSAACLALILLAALLRELAAPILLVMAGFAAWERRPREAMAWTAAFAVFALVLWRHALAVQALYLPTDTASPGWLFLSGWPFVLHAATWTAFTLAGSGAVVVLFPLALLGFSWVREPALRRAAVIVFGFSAGLMVVGRPVNFYWGLMIAPLWPLGLIFAPRALTALVRDLGRLLRPADRMGGAPIDTPVRFPHKPAL